MGHCTSSGAHVRIDVSNRARGVRECACVAVRVTCVQRPCAWRTVELRAAFGNSVLQQSQLPQLVTVRKLAASACRNIAACRNITECDK